MYIVVYPVPVQCACAASVMLWRVCWSTDLGLFSETDTWLMLLKYWWVYLVLCECDLNRPMNIIWVLSSLLTSHYRRVTKYTMIINYIMARVYSTSTSMNILQEYCIGTGAAGVSALYVEWCTGGISPWLEGSMTWVLVRDRKLEVLTWCKSE